MLPNFEIDTGSIELLIKDVKSHEERTRAALWIIADIAAKKIEEYAKNNAPWKDRTSNARQGLIGEAYWDSGNKEKLIIAVAHQVDYGIWLELAHERKYAILEQSIQSNLPEIQQAFNKLLGG